MEKKITHKKKLGGYPAPGVILIITLALFVNGLFGLLISYSKQFEELVRENINMKVYLKSQLSETQRKQIEQTLASKEFVAHNPQPITFISKEQAEADLIKQIGDYKDILGENPLKDVYVVQLDPLYHDTVKLNTIAAELKNINGVLDAEYEKTFLESVNKNFTKISLVLLAVAMILSIAVIFLIRNTIRLALFSQRFLIRSMQLVGARNWFIQRPFLFRAALYGMLGGVIASSLLWLLTNYAYQRIEELALLHDERYFIFIIIAITVFGICIAVLSTFFSIRRYLKMSLDELY